MLHEDFEVGLSLLYSFEFLLLDKQNLRVHSQLPLDWDRDPESITGGGEKAIDERYRSENTLGDVMPRLRHEVEACILQTLTAS